MDVAIVFQNDANILTSIVIQLLKTLLVQAHLPGKKPKNIVSICSVKKLGIS